MSDASQRRFERALRRATSSDDVCQKTLTPICVDQASSALLDSSGILIACRSLAAFRFQRVTRFNRQLERELRKPPTSRFGAPFLLTRKLSSLQLQKQRIDISALPVVDNVGKLHRNPRNRRCPWSPIGLGEKPRWLLAKDPANFLGEFSGRIRFL